MNLDPFQNIGRSFVRLNHFQTWLDLRMMQTNILAR